MGYASHGEVVQRETAGRLRELERIVAELRGKVASLNQQVMAGGGGGGYGGGNTPKDLVYALTGGGGIAARVTTTLGSATVTLYTKSGTTLTAVATTATCYNGSTTAVAASKVIGMVERADGTGTYDVVMESC